jgi:polysaccharide chain length determinant protein (PEP-CTERM system associated)
MVRNGEISKADVKRIMRRFWWILPTAIFGCGLVAVVIATVLPKRFTSTTLVLVDQPTVPTDLVRPVVTEDINHRLASMQEQILSRTRLEPIIEKFGLYQQERAKVHIEDLVERLRSAVTVTPMEPMPGTQNRQLPGFYVNVTFDNPQIAQQICTEITSMFMEQNARSREQQATRTTSFLSTQLEEAKAKLDEQDAKLAEFKKKYLGSLPEEEQSNLSLLMGMNTQLEANTQAMSRAQQDKAFNESLLNQQEATWKASQKGQSPETQEQLLAALQDQLAALQSRYTDDHPDVIKVKSQLEDIKKRIAEGAKPNTGAAESTQARASEPPQIQQLRAKLRQDDLSISDLTKRQAQIQEQIRVLQGRVQASPVVDQQFKEMTRNYQSAQDFYNELSKKRQNSAMATDLEHQQESEQFRVLDPPSLPSKPSFPNRAIFGGGGLGAGLALAIGILYALAMSDKSFHNERDVELTLKVPVLALVPALEVVASNGKQLSRIDKPLGPMEKSA